MIAAPKGWLDRIVAYPLALWFGCGLVPLAPGTAGTAGAFPLFFVLRPYGVWAVGAAALLITVVGIWAGGRVAINTGMKDPQVVVIDEVAGVLITWMAVPAEGWWGVLAGFVLFRLFDQFKPWPANAAEKLPGGYGIVLDDVVAGIFGALVLLGVRAAGWL